MLHQWLVPHLAAGGEPVHGYDVQTADELLYVERLSFLQPKLQSGVLTDDASCLHCGALLCFANAKLRKSFGLCAIFWEESDGKMLQNMV